MEWLEVENPSPAQLEQIARRYRLHETSVADCLDPIHLPKHERFGETVFLILRAHDVGSPADADTIQELTRKIALFIGPDFLITITRKELPFLRSLSDQWKASVGQGKHLDRNHVLAEIFRGALLSFETPLCEAEERLEKFEEGTFRPVQGSSVLEEGYVLRRRASVIRRMIRMSTDSVVRLNHEMPQPILSAPILQDLRETGDRLHFSAEELVDSVNQLLNLHLSIASYRTNEVVRLLTVISLFFLPLNFMAGVYGMNFEWMPELKWRFGYPAILLAMGTVTLGIYLWFRRRGWLRE